MKLSTRNKTKTNKDKCKLKQDENVMFQINIIVPVSLFWYIISVTKDTLL